MLDNGIKILFITAVLLCASAMPQSARASELTAMQLQENCAEIDKSFLGQKFDAGKAQICKGYIMGFFDSLIIFDQITKTRQICVPNSLPKTQNSLILTSWINKNKKIAETTTASVALYSAYTTAFPCR